MSRPPPPDGAVIREVEAPTPGPDGAVVREVEAPTPGSACAAVVAGSTRNQPAMRRRWKDGDRVDSIARNRALAGG